MADGDSTTSNADISVGVAVAISDTVSSNTATVESTTGATSLSAPTISVDGDRRPRRPDAERAVHSASATAGASGTNVGLAGDWP